MSTPDSQPKWWAVVLALLTAVALLAFVAAMFRSADRGAYNNGRRWAVERHATLRTCDRGFHEGAWSATGFSDTKGEWLRGCYVGADREAP